MTDSPVNPHDATQRSFMWKSLQIVARIFTTLWFDLKVYGREHVPKHGGVLLVANHQSYLDPVLLAVRLNRPVSYMAKSELFANRFFSWFIRSLHAFPVRQGEGDVGAVKETIRRLKEGHLLNIYPEGSRTKTGELGPIMPGVALIIRRAGVPVVPVAIHGSFEAWPTGTSMFHPAPIRVMYGPPLQVENMKAPQIVALLDKTLREMMEKLKATC